MTNKAEMCTNLKMNVIVINKLCTVLGTLSNIFCEF